MRALVVTCLNVEHVLSVLRFPPESVRGSSSAQLFGLPAARMLFFTVAGMEPLLPLKKFPPAASAEFPTKLVKLIRPAPRLAWYTPPPVSPAALPETVLLMRSIEEECTLYRPAPRSAELPEKVLEPMLAVPLKTFAIAPPLSPARFPMKVLSVTVRAAWFQIAPALLLAEFPVKALLRMVAVPSWL